MSSYKRTSVLSHWLPLIVLAVPIGVLSAAPESSRVFVQEDFESYTNTAALRAVWQGGTAELDPDAPGGGKAARHDGGDLNELGGFAVRPDTNYDVVFSADLYDTATNVGRRVTVALRNGSGANLEFGHIYEVGPYAMRLNGFARPTEWVSFDPLIAPHRGWNRFRAIVSMTNTVVMLDLGADGTIDQTLQFPGPAPAKPFTSIRFGGLPERVSHGGPIWVDNIRLALVPADEALPPLHARAGAPPVSENPTNAASVTNAPPVTNASPTARASVSEPAGMGTALWWIVGALGVIIALLASLLLVLRRGNHNASGASGAWSVTPVAAADVTGVDARKSAAAAQDPAVAQVAEFAKHKLVQGLYSQRQALIEMQNKAQHELTELEARLVALQLPLQDRIRAYEKRIAELEKELESRGEEMHELTRVTLQLVREKLEEEKTRERTSNRFN